MKTWDEAALAADQSPLKVAVEGSKLTLSIGVGTLAYCAHEGHRRSWRGWVVSDPDEFARGVVEALTTENEIGDTMLNRLLGRACLKSLEEGQGVEEGDSNGRH